MFKRFAAAFVIGLLLQTLSIVQPAYGKSKVEQQARLTEKVRAGVAKLGTGQDAHIAVKLRDKTKLKGYISEVKDASFTVTDLKTGSATEVSYADVTQVKGHNLSTGAKVAIGLAILAAVLAILLIFENYG